MRMLDQQYTATPFYGVKKMTHFLREQGYVVGKDRVRTLLRQLGLEAIYPRRSFSHGGPDHTVYPYLLREVMITQPDQVWRVRILPIFDCFAGLLIW